MRKILAPVIALVIVAGLLIAAVPALSPQVEASVSNYEIISVTRTGLDQITVRMQVLFCPYCNPNDASEEGCEPFTHGYPPPHYPYQYFTWDCYENHPGRYVAVRLRDAAGDILGTSEKLVCNPTNWPLNQLITADLVVSNVALEGVSVVTAEADVYCNWCGHWYPQPRDLALGPLKICIDAGHGGTDIGLPGWSNDTPGTASFPSEKWINLEIAQNLERLLRAQGFEVCMTRATDANVTLQQRCATANTNSCTMFVSIHANGFVDTAVHGTETHYLPGSINGRDLAKRIQAELVDSIGLMDRGVKSSQYYVLEHTNMRAALVEVGFLTNRDDFDFLTNERQRSRIIEIAEEQLGKPYVWGGSGPDGFDCSGLVYRSYHDAGANIPRTTAEEYYVTYSNPFDSVENLIPGDLLFVYMWVPRYGRYGIDHIGILTDRNTVIHASYTAGEVVEEGINLSLWNRFGRIKPEHGAFANLDTAARGILSGITKHLDERGLTINAKCPVDLVVTDPDGLRICKDFTEIPGASYAETEVNGDQGVQIWIPDRKIGDYLIEVVPKPDALPTDTFTLEISLFGVPVIIARNVQIGDIPTEPYVVISTEEGIIPPIIGSTIDFDPNVLNLRSRGGVVTAYIELPEGYDVGQIDVSSIRLNDTVTALEWPYEVGDYNDNGIPDLMVKFDRRAVHQVVDVGESVEITITGEVGGIPFMGTDTIRVIG